MAIQRIFQYIKEKITGAIKRMNNGEKNLKNAEVSNEKIQQEKRVKKVNHIGLYENRELSWL